MSSQLLETFRHDGATCACGQAARYRLYYPDWWPLDRPPHLCDACNQDQARELRAWLAQAKLREQKGAPF